jgi:hypothetical protein
MHQHIPYDERAARSRRRRADRGTRAGDSALPGAADSVTPRSVRKGVISMLVAAAVLLAFNSVGLRTWAHGLPGNAAADMLVAGADRWHAMMRRAGLATAMMTVQDAVAAFRDQGWPVTSLPSSGRTRLADEK